LPTYQCKLEQVRHLRHYFIGNDLLKAFEQVKEMHKQEIIEACNLGYFVENAEEYYQETFKND